ncbi:hypothetical protein WJX73_002345 [Symbiochloris irregularis]|uniref:Uncharacterized protein n=1 Tax=Symbiochloris irregularis TaxID=706552 RepID=A0AAW1PJ31_9CHLO
MDLSLDAEAFRGPMRDPDQESALARLTGWTQSDAFVNAAGRTVLQELPLHYVKLAQQHGPERLLGLDGLDALAEWDESLEPLYTVANSWGEATPQDGQRGYGRSPAVILPGGSGCAISARADDFATACP